MNLLKTRLSVSILSATITLALAGGYRAMAQQPSLRTTRTAEQRIADLENKVLSLQFKVKAMESTLDRVPRLGTQDADH